MDDQETLTHSSVDKSSPLGESNPFGKSSTDQARIDAAVSVEALLGDLRHVVGRMPHEEWPAMARQVLEYHDPPIDTALLNGDHIGLQEACRATLDALIADDYGAAKSSIQAIRRYEVRLGLELEDIRSDDPA